MAALSITIMKYARPLAFYYRFILSRSRGTVFPDYLARIVDPISVKYDTLFPCGTDIFTTPLTISDYSVVIPTDEYVVIL